MLKATIKKTRKGARAKIRARRTSAAEAVALMAKICEAYCENVPGATPEKLLDAVRYAMEADAEEKKDGGLTVRCHKPEDCCEDRDPTGWCSRFDRMCEEVHDEGEAEDE